MAHSVNDSHLITDLNVNEYFHDAIHDAMSHQSITAKDTTVVYIVNLLSYFTLSEKLFESDTEGSSSRPLALIYKDAVEAESREERNAHLRRLGDVALFTSGFFSENIKRSAVGVDYFVSMGGNAYSSLASSCHRSFNSKGLCETFIDLAEHFLVYVDVLTEVSESSELNDDRDVLSLYESWLETGSDYARQRLQENGVLTFPGCSNKH